MTDQGMIFEAFVEFDDLVAQLNTSVQAELQFLRGLFQNEGNIEAASHSELHAWTQRAEVLKNYFEAILEVTLLQPESHMLRQPAKANVESYNVLIEAASQLILGMRHVQ